VDGLAPSMQKTMQPGRYGSLALPTFTIQCER
jgi:hypothetical protein